MEENTEESTAPEQPIPAMFEWLITWLQAVTSPRVDTYQEIASYANIKTAYIWLVLTLLLSSIFIMMFIGWVLFVTDSYGPLADLGYGMAGVSLRAVYGGIGLLVYLVVGLALFSGVTALLNAIAKAFGGVGDFRQLIYCFAAFSLPVSIVFFVLGILSQVPCALCLVNQGSLTVFIYAFVLNVISIKAVHQIDAWKAAVSSAVIVGLILVIAYCGLLGWFILAIP